MFDLVKYPVTERRFANLSLARILVAGNDPASRLTLQTILDASGYHVRTAVTSWEAVALLEGDEWDLVLTDLEMESPEAGLKVIAHANRMDYLPATAIVTTFRNWGNRPGGDSVLVETEDIPELLSKVTNLLARRVNRRMERELAHLHD